MLFTDTSLFIVLLSKGRGKECDPGEFRRTQNWIGGSRSKTAAFVPPPPEYVQECKGKLELFLHNQPEKTTVLIKAALAHVQFETIHPFLDDNGRLGCLIITPVALLRGSDQGADAVLEFVFQGPSAAKKITPRRNVKM